MIVLGQLQGRKPLLGQMPDNSHWARDRLVAHYIMNEGGGNKLYDVSGYGYSGTFGTGAETPTWGGGRKGNSISFDGGDVVLLPDKMSQLANATEISVSVWFNSNLKDSTFHRIINSFNQTKFQLATWSTNTIYWQVNTVSGNRGVGVPASSWNTGTWYNFVGTYDGVTLNAYLNGVFSAGTVYNLALNIPTSGINTIGRNHQTNQYWSGYIDNIRLYSRALTHSEIQRLYWDEYPEYTDRLWAGGAAGTQLYEMSMDAGGISGGSFSKTMIVDFLSTKGGISGGSPSINRITDFLSTKGGISGGQSNVNNLIDIVSSNGGIAGGESTNTIIVDVSGDGGGIVGGLAGKILLIVFDPVAGGITGGVATIETVVAGTQVYSMSMDGGGISGGLSDILSSMDFTSTKGGIAGGTPSKSFVVDASFFGGGIVGGESGRLIITDITSIAGGITGGVATIETFAVSPTQLFTMIMDGGAVSGGVTDLLRLKILSMIGGGLIGGTATVSIPSATISDFNNLYFLAKESKIFILTEENRIFEVKRKD